MTIELTPEEIHWIRYALIVVIAELPADLSADSETRIHLQNALEKLPAFVDTDKGGQN